MRKLFYFLTILFFVNEPIFAQTNDTFVGNNAVLQTDTSKSSEHFENDNGLAIFALMTFIFTCIFTGIGIVLAILVLLILLGLITIGIISSSVFVGLNKQSFSAGVKTFIVSFLPLAVCSFVYQL